MPIERLRGRPRRKAEPSPPLQIATTPKLVTYLDMIVEEEGHGTSRAEVARRFIWDGINKLISEGLIDRLKGSISDPESGP